MIMKKSLILAALAAATLTASPAPADAATHHQLWLGLREVHTLRGDGCMPTFTFRGRYLQTGFCEASAQTRPETRANTRDTLLRPGDTFQIEAAPGGDNPCYPRGRLVVKSRSVTAQTAVVKCARP
jgi:hypothetical protein